MGLLTNKRKLFTRTALQEFRNTNEDFLAQITKKYYSGRRADDTGLRRVSGRLVQGWNSDVRREGIDVVARLLNDVPYAPVHEFGSTSKNIPKRTDVLGDLKTTDLFSRATQKAIDVL